MKKFLLSFKYAIEGIITTIKEERNIKIHLLAIIIVIIMGITYRINIIEWIICIVLFGLVISLELVNTAIENTVDLVTDDKKELAKKAKDAAAGAVLISAIISVIIASFIWLPKIFLK